MSRPHNCRHCAFMCCGDANWCEMDALTMVELHEHVPQSKGAVLDGQTRLEVGE